MEEKLKELLPIGSVVRLKKAEKKLVVMGILQFQPEKEMVYDYVGVTYPEGFMGVNSCFLFQHADIEGIVFRGFEDKERQLSLEFVEMAIKKAVEEVNAG